MTREPDRARPDRAVIAAVLGPALLAGVVCAIALTRRSLWLDEGATVAIASAHGTAFWHAIAHDGGNMLAYYLGLHVLIGWFGDAVVVLRAPSVVASMVSAGACAWLGWRWFASARVAAVAGGLCALSVSLLYWGQTARGYAAMVAMVALSFVALERLLVGASADAPVARRTGALAGYGLALGLALYLGFDAVLVVPAQLVIAWRAGGRPALRRLLGVLVMVGLGCIPLVVLAAHRGSGQLFWVGPLSGSVLWDAVLAITGTGYPPNFHVGVVTVVAAVGALGLLGTAALGELRRPASAPAAWWLGLPFVLVLVAAALGEPVEVVRISLLLIPPAALLLASVLVGVEGAVGPRVAFVLLVTLVGLRIALLVPTYTEDPEPWKAVVAAVTREASTSRAGCVAFYPQDGREPFGYHVRRGGLAVRAPRSILPSQPWSELTPHVEQYDVPDPARLAVLVRGCSEVWLIASHQGSRTGTPGSRRNAVGYRRLLGELGRVVGSTAAPMSRRYGYAAAITVTRFGSG